MIFDHLNHFTEAEPWGDPKKMVGYFLLTLDKLREVVGIRMAIHCGTQGEHSNTGYHPKGLAADFHFISPLSLWQQLISLNQGLVELNLLMFCGLGVYPDWNHPGFHFDLRGSYARWGAINVSTNGNNKQTYISWEDLINLIGYGERRFL